MAVDPGPSGPPPGEAGLPSADAVLAQAGAENFPVALGLLGPRTAADLMALYGFARLVDDAGDESAGDRLARLDELEAQLDSPRHPLMVTLAETVARRGLSRDPLARLIEANRRDQVVSRYDDNAALWEYCMLSAAPVGQLVLELFGRATPERIALSDRVCAALQVIEHLQDREEDLARGRDYIADREVALAWAGELLGAGPPLVASLSGRPRLAVAGFLAGGRVALAGLWGWPTGPAAFAWQFLRALAGR